MQELDDQFDPAETGRPAFYAAWGEQLVLGPVPDGGYALTHRYVKSEPTLTNSTDTPLMPARFHHAIVEYAAYLAFRRAEQSGGGRYAALLRTNEALKAYQGWQRVMADDRRRVSSPLKVRVRADSPF